MGGELSDLCGAGDLGGGAQSVGAPPPSIPPHKGEGGGSCTVSVLASPSPLWGGIKGGGGPKLDGGAYETALS